MSSNLRKLKSFFFGPEGTEYSKFSYDNIPTEETFKKLFDSVAFFAEESDQGDIRRAGLVGFPDKDDYFNHSYKYGKIRLAVSLDGLPKMTTYVEDEDDTIVDQDGNIESSVYYNPNIIKYKGLKITELYFQESGKHINDFKLVVNDEHFEFNSTTQELQIKDDAIDSNLIESVNYDSIISFNEGFIIGNDDGTDTILNPSNSSIIAKKDDGTYVGASFNNSFFEINDSDEFELTDNSIAKEKFVAGNRGAMYVSNGTEITEIELTQDSQIIIGRSEDTPHVVRLSGDMSIDADGVVSISDDAIEYNNISSSLLSDNMEINSDNELDIVTQDSITSDSSGLKLDGDSNSPGVNKYYGTNSTGDKGFNTLPDSIFENGSGVSSVVQSGFSNSEASAKYSFSEAHGKAIPYGSKARALDTNSYNNRLELHYIGATSDSEETELFLGNVNNERYEISGHKALYITAKILGFSQRDTVYAETRYILIKTVNSVLTLVDSNTVDSYSSIDSYTSTNLVISVNDSNNRLEIKTTGAIGEWFITLDVLELNHPV